MKPPANLYRYRPLGDAQLDLTGKETLLDRELDALRDSYLYAPSFADMNDPMEAFYENAGPDDCIINMIFDGTGKHIDDMYRMHRDTMHKLGLVSFARTYEDLPMWAYYGSNFAGMCLEFDAVDLAIGDFRGEPLRPVTYARKPLPPLSLGNIGCQEANIGRLTRKRCEWRHEKEWRFITGEVGPKHYLDDALRRVFLGPRAKDEHVARVCQVLDHRPVEILKGHISGFELSFRTIQAATPLDECQRVGAGRFDPAEHLYSEQRIRNFLNVAFDSILRECRQTVRRPNAEELVGVDVSDIINDTIYFQTIYKLRNGHEVYHKRYFDRNLRLILADHK